MENIINHLDFWVARQPNARLFSFLDVHGTEIERYSYREFDDRSSLLAAQLRNDLSIKFGDRVLLAYPPGLECLVALFACAKLGALAVPVCAPFPGSIGGAIDRLHHVAVESGAGVALTSSSLLRRYEILFSKSTLSSALRWYATDEVHQVFEPLRAYELNPLFFLQYTSGSTQSPKGVVVTQRGVIHNCHGIVDHCAVAVTWLPQFHDMGLIGYYLFILIKGGCTYGFSPFDFVRRPSLWLETLSRVRATVTASPNFGYEYCLRADKVPETLLPHLDLSSIRCMMNAAEPVQSETFSRFFDRFSVCGLRREAYVTAYGLAENTLAVSLGGMRAIAVSKRRLRQNLLRIEDSPANRDDCVAVMDCGRPIPGVSVRIVDSKTLEEVGHNRIGEIWITGESVASGYWNNVEATKETFCAQILASADDRAYVRSGDLGFMHRESLYVCGRIKDVINVRGAQYYPQDIEHIVEQSSGLIRKGRCVAFSLSDGGDEKVIVLVEPVGPNISPDLEQIAQAVRQSYFVSIDTLVVVVRDSICKTTSGKIARKATKDLWLRGEIQVLAAKTFASGSFLRNDNQASSNITEFLEAYGVLDDTETTIRDLGIDSITLVGLIGDLKDILKEKGLFHLMEQVDFKMLHGLTIAEFSKLINAILVVDETSTAELEAAIHQQASEFEAREQELMRTDSKLPASIVGILSGKPIDPRRTLLTGATGFLGPFFLRDLLEISELDISVIVRAENEAAGKMRLLAGLREAKLLNASLQKQFDSRVKVLCGDLSQPRLGLSAEVFQLLCEETDSIYHNAAMVNYVLTYEEMRKHTVVATAELLRVAISHHKKWFHLISTTFINGWVPKSVLREVDRNDAMERLDFGYAQTKWVAEQLVFDAAEHGLPVRVYRPSLVSASTGSVYSRSDIMLRLLCYMIRHQIALDIENQIGFFPADVATRNMVALSLLKDPGASTFHLTPDHYYSLRDVTECITQQYGYRFRYVKMPQFIQEMNAICSPDDLLYPLIEFLNKSHKKIDAMSHKRYDNAAYRSARARSPHCLPLPPLNAVIDYIVRYLLEERLIEARDSRSFHPPVRSEKRRTLADHQTQTTAILQEVVVAKAGTAVA